MAELAKVEPAVQEAKMGKLGLEASVTNTDKALCMMKRLLRQAL